MSDASRSSRDDDPYHSASASRARGDDRVESERMSFGEHLEELRSCLILALVGLVICAAGSLFFAKRILVFILTPAVVALRAHGQSPNLLALSPAAPFILYLKVGLLSGLVIGMPWILYQGWCFVRSGLYAHERRFVGRFVPVSIGLFVAGVVFMFYVVLPIVLNFFISFADALDLPELRPTAIQKLIAGEPEPEPVTATPDLDMTFPVVTEDPADPPPGAAWINSRTHSLNVRNGDKTWGVDLKDMSKVSLVSAQYGLQFFVSLVFALAIGFGLAFELPVVVVFLAAMGIVTTREMTSARRYVLFGIVVAAAILTPPDVVSQILLAIPMMLLFEGGLLVARTFERSQ